MVWFLLLALFNANAEKILIEESWHVPDKTGAYFRDLKDLGGLSLDHRDTRGFEVYGPEGTSLLLTQLGVPFSSIKLGEMNLSLVDYPSPEEVGTELQALAAAHPAICQIFSIGSSVNGRPLWMLKISDRVELDETEPEFKYIANMHGDEIVGRELMMRLAREMLESYGRDDQITRLIDNTEIYIMASMNPDGAASHHRGNGNHMDLNRDFPDFTSDPINTPNGREPETQAMMRFQSERFFALSANFHGGAEVVNYPWDTTDDLHPLDGLAQDLSLAYASNVPYISASSEFPRGIVRGYAWYEVDGGMQDWSIHWHNDMHVTIEVSNLKWPSYSRVEGYYKENRRGLLRYIEMIHQGAGFKLDTEGLSGMVIVSRHNGEQIGEFAFHQSEFYKVLAPGEYTFDIKLSDGQSLQLAREVQELRF